MMVTNLAGVKFSNNDRLGAKKTQSLMIVSTPKNSFHLPTKAEQCPSKITHSGKNDPQQKKGQLPTLYFEEQLECSHALYLPKVCQVTGPSYQWDVRSFIPGWDAKQKSGEEKLTSPVDMVKYLPY